MRRDSILSATDSFSSYLILSVFLFKILNVTFECLFKVGFRSGLNCCVEFYYSCCTS